jgi:hypothetical protein
MRLSMKRRRNLPGPFSTAESLTSLDRRTVPARIMKTVARDLLAHIGDGVTAPQKLLVQSAALKAVRLALLTDRLLTDEKGLAEGADHHALAWLNSLRLDLVALGLERREKPVLNLAAFLAAAPADAPTPDAGHADTTMVDAA